MALNHFYYLFFHVLVLASIFLAKIFYRKMTLPFRLMPKVLPVTLLFVVTDALVTKHWWFFNDFYLLPWPKIFNLPIEEILFFITVPFGLLTFLENLSLLALPDLNKRFLQPPQKFLAWFRYLVLFVLLIFTLLNQWWYSGAMLTVLIILLADFWNLSRAQFFAFIFTILMTLIFNYYLTVLPIVTYNQLYKSGLMILSIPLEDFIYGIIFYLLILRSVYGQKKPSFP